MARGTADYVNFYMPSSQVKRLVEEEAKKSLEGDDKGRGAEAVSLTPDGTGGYHVRVFLKDETPQEAG